MVGKVGNIPHQAFSQSGLKLSELKDKNQLLFNYFTEAGYKEDAIIYASDIENLTKDIDTDGDGKLSKKELRAKFGDDLSRKDRNAIKDSLNFIKSNDLSNSEELLPETVDEHSTNYKNNKGELIYTKTNDSIEGEKKIYYIEGNQNKIDRVETASQTPQGLLKTTTYYVDGDETRIKRQITDDAGDITDTEYNWDGSSLVSTTTTHGNDVTFTKYKNINGRDAETTVIEQYKSDPNSFVSTENKYDENGGLISQTKEFNGAKFDNRTKVLKQKITLNRPIPPEMDITDDNIKEAQLTVLNDKNQEEIQIFTNIGNKYQRVEKDDNGNYFVTIKIPKGWSIDKLAEEFGVTKEKILEINKDSKGNPLYYTTANGTPYFYANDNVRILNPTKISQEISNEQFVYGDEAKLKEVETSRLAARKFVQKNYRKRNSNFDSTSAELPKVVVKTETKPERTSMGDSTLVQSLKRQGQMRDVKTETVLSETKRLVEIKHYTPYNAVSGIEKSEYTKINGVWVNTKKEMRTANNKPIQIKTFHPNGDLASIEKYSKGVIAEKHTFHPSGRPESDVEYRNGKAVLYIVYYDKSGKIEKYKLERYGRNNEFAAFTYRSNNNRVQYSNDIQINRNQNIAELNLAVKLYTDIHNKDIAERRARAREIYGNIEEV